MGRPCSTCTHREAAAIDELLRQETPTSKVAAAYGLSHTSVRRHVRSHLARRTRSLAPPEPSSETTGDPLLELVTALRDRALAGDPVVAREYRLALAAQAAAATAAPPTRDLAAEPDWLELRALLLAVLEAHPAARIAVADVLRARRLAG